MIIRYVSWQAAMLRPVNKVGQYDTVPFSSSHYSNYYVQEEVDDGVVMESTLAVKDVSLTFIFFILLIFLFTLLCAAVHQANSACKL